MKNHTQRLVFPPDWVGNLSTSIERIVSLPEVQTPTTDAWIVDTRRSWVWWWHTSISLVPRRLRQNDLEIRPAWAAIQDPISEN